VVSLGWFAKAPIENGLLFLLLYSALLKLAVRK